MTVQEMLMSAPDNPHHFCGLDNMISTVNTSAIENSLASYNYNALHYVMIH